MSFQKVLKTRPKKIKEEIYKLKEEDEALPSELQHQVSLDSDGTMSDDQNGKESLENNNEEKDPMKYDDLESNIIP